MCANPRCRNALALQMHHLIWVKDGGDSQPANLVALCAYCHDLHTRGVIDRQAIATWKLLLQSLNDALDRDSLDQLLFLRRHNEEFDRDGTGWQLRVSGDGIIRLARLVNAGLVDMGFTAGGGGSYGAPAHGLYRPTLTGRGRRLVEAWEKGDLVAFGTALQGEENLSA